MAGRTCEAAGGYGARGARLFLCGEARDRSNRAYTQMSDYLHRRGKGLPSAATLSPRRMDCGAQSERLAQAKMDQGSGFSELRDRTALPLDHCARLWITPPGVPPTRMSDSRPGGWEAGEPPRTRPDLSPPAPDRRACGTSGRFGIARSPREIARVRSARDRPPPAPSQSLPP
jgi:hypothetical protein